MILEALPDALLLGILACIPPPWFTLIKVLRTSKEFARHTRHLVFNECRSLDMRPRETESTGSLLNALRHVKHARAFWNRTFQNIYRFTIRMRDTTIVIDVDRIRGTAAVAAKQPQTRLMMPWKALDVHDGGDQRRFVWANGLKALLVTSTNETFEVCVCDDNEEVKLVSTTRVNDHVGHARYFI